MLYRIGKKEGMPMTEVVDRLLRYGIEKYNEGESLETMDVRFGTAPQRDTL